MDWSHPPDLDDLRNLEDSENEGALGRYVEVLWGYRKIIAATIVGGAVLFALASLTAILRLPVERVASLQFRLLFEGAAQNQYPNGTQFSPTEIVATPVLTAVYESNDLRRFGTYRDFKESMFILGANSDVDLLAHEYQSKLSEARLSPVDRARIEDEFRRKREALTDPVFSLNMRRHERLATLPRDLTEKVLTDTLSTWAEQADERKGATRYNVPLLSTNTLQRDLLERDDYLVVIDVLRVKTNRVINTIDTLAKLPGAEGFRTGQEKISLADVRTNLEDVVRFKLEPLIERAGFERVTKDVDELRLYLDNQLSQVRLERDRLQSHVRTLLDALGRYMAQQVGQAPDTPSTGGGSSGAASGGPAFMPQLEQSFLDRLMSLPTAEKDQAYRQSLTDRIIQESGRLAVTQREAAFYERLATNIRGVGSRDGGTRDTLTFIKARTAEAFDEVSKAVDQISALYRELSARNLNPSTTLYSVTGPFAIHVQRPLTLRTVAMYFVLLMMVTLILLPAACLVHHTFRRRPADRYERSLDPSSEADILITRR